MAILNLAKQILVVGKAFRSAMTVVKIYISMNPIELNTEITKFIINDLTTVYRLKLSIQLNIQYISIIFFI